SFICLNSLRRVGASIDKEDKQGNTPLHIASKSGFSSLVSLLIDLGAMRHVTNKAGKTPRDVALDSSVAALFGMEEYLTVVIGKDSSHL
ncbi:unnamed protein product, partial [Choristocarpus tenellus]